MKTSTYILTEGKHYRQEKGDQGEKPTQYKTGDRIELTADEAASATFKNRIRPATPSDPAPGGDVTSMNAQDAISYVGGLDSVDDLEAARAVEIAGDQRVTVLRAIDNAIADLED